MHPEIQSYLQLIEDLRSQVADLITDLPPEALKWRPIEGTDDHATNSLAVLAAHVAGAERFWIVEVIGGRPSTRNREAEFVTQVADFSELCSRLKKTGMETQEVLATLPESDLNGTREARGRTVSVRWCILHIIDHTALHLGHMQITYQLWQSGQGTQS